MNQGFVPLSLYEEVLQEIRNLKQENNQLRRQLNQQDFVLSSLRSFNTSPLNTVQSTGTWSKPPVSPKHSFSNQRSGSVRSRRIFVSKLSSAGIEDEIKRAEEFRQKSYEDFLNSQFSPRKSERFRNIVERWDIEIEALKRKRDLFGYENFN